MMKSVAFVPIKMNNERLPGKNVKCFTNGKPLIEYILGTLKNVNEIDAIYVYCSSEEVCKYLPEGIQFLKRKSYLDKSETKFNEVLISFAQDVSADLYILAHATAPFISVDSIRQGILAVQSGKYDSALAVEKMQDFLWFDGRPFNYDPENIPRTQDLKPYYKETCGLYVYLRELILTRKKRIGDIPFLIEVSKFESIDINDFDDFMLAEAARTLMNI